MYFVERVKGIEPSYAAWEAAVLPLNYTREAAQSAVVEFTSGCPDAQELDLHVVVHATVRTFAAQAELGVVGGLYGLLFGLEAEHRRDRPIGFFARAKIFCRGLRHHGGLEELPIFRYWVACRTR